MLAIVINNEAELKKLLRQGARNLVKTLSADTKEQLYQNTKNSVYKNEPAVYERTEEFAQSITDEQKYISQADKYESTIYFNAEDMSLSTGIYSVSVSANDIVYGKHQSVYNEDVREALIGWLEEGHKGARPFRYDTMGKRVGRHKYPSREGSHMIRDTAKWLEKDRLLRVAGIFGGRTDSQISIRMR